MISYPTTNFSGEKFFAGITPKTHAFQATDTISTMAVAGHHMWVALDNGGIEIRDVHTGDVARAFASASRPSIATKVWSMLAVVSATTGKAEMWLGLSSGTIAVYDATAYNLVRQLRKHMSGVYCLAACRGTTVYSGSSDFTIAQWRAADGRLLRILSGHSNYVRCLYAEGAAVVSGSDDRTIRLWDADTGALVQMGSFHASTGGVSALCRAGVTMWSGDESGYLAVWRLQDCTALLVSRPHQARITSLHKVGSRMYSGSADGVLCVINALDGTIVHHMTEHAGSRVMAVQCAAEVDRYYTWTGAADNTIRCWHHDEHVPMNPYREGFNDMRWYYATQRPYRESCEKLLDEQQELAELVVLSNGSDEAVRQFLENSNESRQSSAVKYWVLQNSLRETQKKTAAKTEEARLVERVLENKKQTIEVMRKNLQKMTDALNAARLYAAQNPRPAAAPVPVPGPVVTTAIPAATVVPLAPNAPVVGAVVPPAPASAPTDLAAAAAPAPVPAPASLPAHVVVPAAPAVPLPSTTSIPLPAAPAPPPALPPPAATSGSSTATTMNTVPVPMTTAVTSNTVTSTACFPTTVVLPSTATALPVGGTLPTFSNSAASPLHSGPVGGTATVMTTSSGVAAPPTQQPHLHLPPGINSAASFSLCSVLPTAAPSPSTAAPTAAVHSKSFEPPLGEVPPPPPAASRPPATTVTVFGVPPSTGAGTAATPLREPVTAPTRPSEDKIVRRKSF